MSFPCHAVSISIPCFLVCPVQPQFMLNCMLQFPLFFIQLTTLFSPDCESYILGPALPDTASPWQWLVIPWPILLLMVCIINVTCLQSCRLDSELEPQLCAVENSHITSHIPSSQCTVSVLAVPQQILTNSWQSRTAGWLWGRRVARNTSLKYSTNIHISNRFSPRCAPRHKLWLLATLFWEIWSNPQ